MRRDYRGPLPIPAPPDIEPLPVVVPMPVVPVPVVALISRLVVVLVVVSVVLEHPVKPSVVSATAKVMMVIFFMCVDVFPT